MKIKKNDTVLVITGKDKGKKGKVIAAQPKSGKIAVEGVAIATKHQKSRAQGQPGGIIKKEAFIDASNVMIFCGKCNKPTRVAHQIIEEKDKEGNTKMKNVRICKHCGAQID